MIVKITFMMLAAAKWDPDGWAKLFQKSGARVQD